jgi:S-adenosylmethionine hydrolase
MSRIIALLSDFGIEDIYVGVMKGVILSINPSAQIVDITHAIRRQNVRDGAFALLNSYHYFPTGTTFCVVVDPDVGSQRLPIAIKTAHYTFIAPNNGILSYVLETLNEAYTTVALTNPSYHLADVSKTFHGRDIFAPAAAHISISDDTHLTFGSQLDDLYTIPTPQITFSNQRLIGEVMHIDHFGNIITSIGRLRWADDTNLTFESIWKTAIPSLAIQAHKAHVTIHSQTIHGITHTYHEANHGDILAQVDSNGFLEIGANQDNAADRLDVQLGDKVTLKFTD